VGQEVLRKENDKVFQETSGRIELAVNKVDPSNEIGGVFVSEQLSDTDMGAKEPKKLLLKGVFYARFLPSD
jgi:photosystem II oxygen-evolving enhancer protein 1